MFKRVATAILITVLIISASIPAFAVTESFTRVDVQGNTTELQLSRDMYIPVKNITAASLGADELLEGITDVFCGETGKILLLCGDKSRLLSINPDYTLDREINVKDKNGEEIDFEGAKGVYCDKNGNIYIADTSNFRVLVLDGAGVLQEIIKAPVSDLIPENFLFQPTSVIIDEQGYRYILSLGCYYGALLYSPEQEFLGFYGSNTVETTALDTLSYLWDKLTSNEEKKMSSVKKLPFAFTDFAFDSDGYMVTCTGGTSSGTNVGQIRKISHNGADILYKRGLRGDSVPASAVGFLETARPEHDYSKQNLVSVEVSDDGYIFALDETDGLIYIYDSECNLMSAFGGGRGEGEQLGVYKAPVALALNGNELLVADSNDYSVTVYEPTEYGNLLRKAQSLYLKGDYDDAGKLWRDVLKLDRSCQLAYRGIAMADYTSGDYSSALENARIAADYSVYDLAWRQIVSQYIADNFIWMTAVAVIIIAAVIYAVIYMKKHKIRLIKSAKLKLMLAVPFHPFRSFEDLKYKKLGSVKISIVLTVLLYLSAFLRETASGFLYTDIIIRNYNALYTLGSTLGLLLLWSVCNWLVCIMFSGKGSFKEVYVSTSYALLPWIVFSFIRVIFTNFLPLSSAGMINGIEIAVMIYTAFLICIAMMQIHEYDFFKFLLTGIVVLFAMILTVFIILMCGILIRQFISFLQSVYEEVAFR